MLPGYAGKILFVDLTKGTWEEKELTADLARILLVVMVLVQYFTI